MYINTETGQYPLSVAQIQELHPMTMMAQHLECYALVEPSDTPPHDADTHKPVEVEPVQVDGVWRQEWSVVPLTEDELAELIPKSCTRRQGRLALLAFGMLDEAEAAIAAIMDPVQKREAEIEYEADTWERGNPFLSGLWFQLGGTPQSLDEAFVLAVTL